jgi:hypothetical protein
MDDAVLIDDVTSSAAKSRSYSSVPKASLSASLSFNSLTHSTPSSYNGQVDLQVTYNGQSLDIQVLTHLLTYSLTYSLTHLLTHLLTYSLTYTEASVLAAAL